MTRWRKKLTIEQIEKKIEEYERQKWLWILMRDNAREELNGYSKEIKQLDTLINRNKKKKSQEK